jgi:hypothetical protein
MATHLRGLVDAWHRTWSVAEILRAYVRAYVEDVKSIRSAAAIECRPPQSASQIKDRAATRAGMPVRNRRLSRA